MSRPSKRRAKQARLGRVTSPGVTISMSRVERPALGRTEARVEPSSRPMAGPTIRGLGPWSRVPSFQDLAMLNEARIDQRCNDFALNFEAE